MVDKCVGDILTVKIAECADRVLKVLKGNVGRNPRTAGIKRCLYIGTRAFDGGMLSCAEQNSILTNRELAVGKEGFNQRGEILHLAP